MGCGLSCRNCTVQVSKLFYIIARWRALRRLTVSGTSCCLWLALAVVCGVVSSNATKVSLIVFVCHQCYWKIFKLSSWKFHSRQQCLWDHAMVDNTGSRIMPWLTAVSLSFSRKSCYDQVCHVLAPCVMHMSTLVDLLKMQKGCSLNGLLQWTVGKIFELCAMILDDFNAEMWFVMLQVPQNGDLRQ